MWSWVVGLVLVGMAGAYVVRRARPAPSGMGISGVLHANINCSDFERSRAFYEMLGFTVLMNVEQTAEHDVAAAVGMASYRVKGALMALPDGSVVDLLQWQDPHDDTPPRGALNQLGIARLALTTTDIAGDIARLKAAGVTFLSDAPARVKDPLGGTTQFICFADPDGTVLELVQMGTVMGTVQRMAKRAQRKG